MKAAAVEANFTGLEEHASTSGADAAAVLCYLSPALDGKQPGACPSMSSRDTTLTMANVSQYRMWVALEAGSGIWSQHDCEPVGSLPGIVGGKHDFGNVTADPFDGTPSPLWAFTKYGPLSYRTAASTLFLRPYLAHCCSVFRRLFAGFTVLTP